MKQKGAKVSWSHYRVQCKMMGIIVYFCCIKSKKRVQYSKQITYERVNFIKRFLKVLIVVLLAICMSFLATSLPYNSAIKAEAATIKLNKEKISLYIGNSYTLKLTGTNQKIEWATFNNDVVWVSQKGQVTGIKKGTATVSAQVGSKIFLCTVTVSNPVINENKLDMEIADTANLSIKGSTGSVTWESSNKKVVTVNKKGFVYAKGEGKAKITGTYKGKKYVCSVTITDKVLHASTTSLVCSRETTLMISVEKLHTDEKLICSIEDPDIINCEWGEWNGNTVPLIVSLNSYGKTKITITADNTDEKLVIDVTAVNDKRPKMKNIKAEDIYDHSSPATAQVNTDLGLGTGFFISSGKLVTNYHVIKGASDIKIQLQNGKVYDVDYIVGYSESLDIAILSIPVETKYLQISPYGLKAGETVYALGSSLGFKDTFTNGIISNVSRYLSDDVEYIQINAAITNGNSGGPLINSFGEVIGINSRCIVDGQNLNFAINIYQLYQVDTSKPTTVKEYYKSIASQEKQSDNPVNYVLEDSEKSGSIETSQLIPFSTNVYGTALPLEMDYYKFTLDEESYACLYGLSYYADNSETSNLVLSIYNEKGELLIGSMNKSKESGLLMKQAITRVPPGTYYAGVSTRLDTTTPITYAISLVSVTELE